MPTAGQITTSTAQVISQLQEINAELQRFMSMYKSASGAIDLNTLITALAGLIGVLIGALISYYFAKRISDYSNRSRIAIQRKNIIFSKLFKEHLALKEFFTQFPEGSKYVEIITPIVSTNQTINYNTFYLDNERYAKPEYRVWNEMKNDIRKNHVPKNLREHLDILEQSVRNYFVALEKFIDERRDFEKNNNQKMIEFFQQDRQNQNSIFNIDYSGIFNVTPDIKSMVENNKKRYALKNESLLNEMQLIIQNVVNMNTRSTVIKYYDDMVASLKQVVELLDQLIQDIVDKYEYGDSLS
jgi:hypothetical protein